MSQYNATDEEVSAEIRRRLNDNTVESLFMAVSMNKPLIVKRILSVSGASTYDECYFADSPKSRRCGSSMAQEPPTTSCSSAGGPSSGRAERPVSPNATNEFGASVLHVAAMKGFADVGRILCIAGANPNALFKGNTPLHLAVADGHSDFCSMLLQHGARINERDGFGFTPLHLAAVRNNRLLANMFIASGADPTLLDGDGKTVAQRWNYNAVNPASRPHLAPNEGYGPSGSSGYGSTRGGDSSLTSAPRSAMSSGGSLDPEVVDKVLLVRFKSFKSFKEDRQVVILPEKVAAVSYHRTIDTAELKRFFLSLDAMGAPPDLHERQVNDMLKDALKIRTSKVPMPEVITFNEFCVVWLKAHAKGLIPT